MGENCWKTKIRWKVIARELITIKGGLRKGKSSQKPLKFVNIVR